MPSTLVHIAFALLCAAGLLGDRFDRRAVLVVAAATTLPDLDVFTSLVIESTHRAAFHSLLVPGAAALALWWDRGQAWLRDRYGPDAVAVAWTGLFGYVVAGIGLDAFTSLGVNPLYPLVDQFVAVDGRVGYSTADGLYQSFFDIGDEPAASASESGGTSVDVGQRGSTEEVHVASGVDPEPGAESTATERVFPVVFRGWHVTLLLAGALATWGRLHGADVSRDHSGER
jgi:hypothetical protein